MNKIKHNGKLLFLVSMVLANTLVWQTVFYFESRQNLFVTFFDVGQGDAVFIEVPNGNRVLIDGGPGDAILSKLGRELPFWDRSIDVLLLSHPHLDHLSGLLEVLKRYRVGMVIQSGVNHSIPEYAEWQRILEQKRVPVITAEAGQVVRLSDSVSLRILTPFESFEGRSVKNVHDSMVVARLVHGSASVMLTGDMEIPLEYRLFWESMGSAFFDLDSRILKVGHHGSKTSTGEEFLRAVSPEFAVIQSGAKNRFGHPHQEVLDRLNTFGTRVLRNDERGDIHFESDGIRYYLR